MTADIPQLRYSGFARGPGFAPPLPRLAAALSLSVLVHLWLVKTITVDVPGQMSSAIPAPITASIEPLAASRDAQAPLHSESEFFDEPVVRQAQGSSGPHRNNPLDSLVSAGPRSPPPIVEGKAPSAPAPAVPQIMDTTYYPAQELDVYPLLLQSISLAHTERAGRGQARGEVLVRLLIDEAGFVNDVSIVRPQSTGYFEELVQTVIANARFSPARKDGRAVRSRVLISIRHGAGAVDGAAE